MTPQKRNTFLFCSSRQLPCFRLGPFKVFFELTFGTTEYQGHSQVCCAKRRGTKTPSRTPIVNLDCAFVENLFFSLFQNWGAGLPPPPLPPSIVHTWGPRQPRRRESKWHSQFSPKQVWPLTQFFLFPFCKKSLIFLEGNQ